MTVSLTLPHLQDFSDPNFDAFAAERAARGSYPDPYPLIERMRQQSAVHHVQYRSLFTDVPDAQIGQLDHWTVFGYDACNEVLTDPENSPAGKPSSTAWGFRSGAPPPAWTAPSTPASARFCKRRCSRTWFRNGATRSSRR